MKYTLLFVIAFFFCLTQTTFGQEDSIRAEFGRYAASKKNDSARFLLYFFVSNYYRRYNYDSALYYGQLALKLSKRMNFELGQTMALSDIEFALRETGDLAGALNIQLTALDKARAIKSETLEGVELNSIGNSYLELGDPKTGLNYYRDSHAVLQKTYDKHNFKKFPIIYWLKNEISNMGNAFEQMGELDSALIYETKLYQDKDFPYNLKPELLCRLANVMVRKGRYHEAMQLYQKGAALSFLFQANSDRAIIYYQTALLFNKMAQPDSGIVYARKAFNTAKSISLRKIMLSSSALLADMFDKEARLDSAFYYQRIEIKYNDTLFGVEKFRHIQLVLSNEQLRQQKILREQEELRQRYIVIGTVITVGFILLILLLVWRNNRVQKKKNHLLSEQKTQITTQRDELGRTLDRLKSTQTQLIQSEKMASLGELTAGIAHEIQNPLNFVNNFSEVSIELLEELTGEAKAGNNDDVIAIAAGLTQNLEKINHHGKRADSIVKGMLQHSQTGSGAKELTNVNTLVDECMRLAYHGLRAKDKSFNAELITNFDKDLPQVNIVPQDIGRVLLNLCNNAFYAVNQKKKIAGDDYKPEVTVSTAPQPPKGGATAVIIMVKDNGNGIPESIKDKIMQPFFTTKPTGEGTGLGLSLSYDIVVNGHGGNITVATKEGGGSEFIVSLPII